MGFLRGLLGKNPLTTGAGIGAVVIALFDVIGCWRGETDLFMCLKEQLPLLIVAVIGFVSKDYNVTGGTSAATAEADKRVKNVGYVRVALLLPLAIAGALLLSAPWWTNDGPEPVPIIVDDGAPFALDR